MGNINRMKGAPEPLRDTTPIELPLGAHRPRSLQDYIATMVRQAVEAERGEEFESWEDSDDFEEEDPDTLDFSRYELQDLQEEVAIRDYGPDPDPEPPQPTAASPDPNVVPAEE